MKHIEYRNFPDGNTKAATFSFDDGHENDLRLAKLLKQYGLKATFNMNTYRLGAEHYLTAEELAGLAAEGHEIAAHAYHHPYLEKLPPDLINREIAEDRRCLEAATGQMVNGFAYPYGTFSEDVKQALRMNGFLYARTAASTNSFPFPADFLEWAPTCHQSSAAMLTPIFASVPEHELSLFYIWGHSFELNCEQFWGDMERMLEGVAKLERVWFATNREIYDYASALRALRWNYEHDEVYNPSAIPVTVTVDGEVRELSPGWQRV